MATSVYLALALSEEVFTASEFLIAGIRSMIKIGNHDVCYTPIDQPLSLDRPLIAYADKQPANDNQEEPIPQPAQPLTESAALAMFMHKLLSRQMPFWAQRLAADWLAHRNEPGATFRGKRIFDQVAAQQPQLLKRFDPSIINALKPTGGRGSLKLMHSKGGPAPGAPQSMPIASRPFLQDWLAHHTSPQVQRKKKQLDYNVAV